MLREMSLLLQPLQCYNFSFTTQCVERVSMQEAGQLGSRRGSLDERALGCSETRCTVRCSARSHRTTHACVGGAEAPTARKGPNSPPLLSLVTIPTQRALTRAGPRGPWLL